MMVEKISKSDEEWKAALSAQSYAVLRKKATDAPFTGELNKHYDRGSYRCMGCGARLFDSSAKFDSGSGWPSFFEAAEPDNVETQADNSLGMRRVEVVCAQCGGHLGHVFEDGPEPTGMRYCINSSALNFEQSAE